MEQEIVNYLSKNGKTSRCALMRKFNLRPGIMGDLVYAGFVHVDYIQGHPYYSVI